MNSATSQATQVNNPSQPVEATSDGGTGSLVTDDGGVMSTVPTPDGGTTAPTGDDGGGVLPSGPPAVQFLGRFDTRDPAGPKTSWPGEQIIARFNGAEVSVTLNEIDYSWEEGTPSYWDVTIDGTLNPQPLILKAGSNVYALATGLATGTTHQVELYRRTEAQNGLTQFLGFDFGADGALQSPPGRKTRRIEVIGDSQSAGFGIVGSSVGPSCPPPVEWSSYWQNYRQAWPVDLGTDLNAEVNGTVYSGKGVYINIWRDDTDTMPLLFNRADPIDPNSTWDFTQYTPEAVLIMMGGNDFAIGQPQETTGPATLQEFTDAYTKFVTDIRSKYAAAHIFLVTSPSVSDDEPAGHRTRTNVMAGIAATVRARAAAGDAKVYAVTPPVGVASELTACDGHGTPAFHQRLADQLATEVKKATGWN
jgi:hypothetical protein